VDTAGNGPRARRAATPATSVSVRAVRAAEENGDFVIRQARRDQDAAACLDIYAPYVSDTAVSFEEEIPSAAAFLDRVRRTSMTHPWLVLEDAGRIVGYAYGAPHRSRAAYRWAAEVTVYVARSHHRRGVGRQLYDELMRRLRGQGMRVACAGVTLPNDASIALHRAVGFQPVGIYRQIGWKHGAWHDVSWWQLALARHGGAPSEPSNPGLP
jgi:L-amino acid N-acyltransferase YncA